MGYSKTQARSVKNAVLAGEEQTTPIITYAVGIVPYIFQLTGPSSMVTVQSTGTLTYTVDYSSTGVDFYDSQSGSATVPVTYSTNVVSVVRITITAGTGRVALLGV